MSEFNRFSTRGKPTAPRSTALSSQPRSTAPTAAQNTPKRNEHHQQAAPSFNTSNHASSSNSVYAPTDVVAYLQHLIDTKDSRFEFEKERLKKQWRQIETQITLLSPSRSPFELSPKSPARRSEVDRTPAPACNFDSEPRSSSSFAVGNASAPTSRAPASRTTAAAAAAKRSPAIPSSSSSGGTYTPAATSAVRDKHYSSSAWAPSPAAAEAAEFEHPSSTDATALRYKTKIVLRGCRSRCLRAVLSSDPLHAGVYTLEADGVGTGSPDEALLLVKVCFQFINYYMAYMHFVCLRMLTHSIALDVDAAGVQYLRSSTASIA
jgi:hypothetical protein